MVDLVSDELNDTSHFLPQSTTEESSEFRFVAMEGFDFSLSQNKELHRQQRMSIKKRKILSGRSVVNIEKEKDPEQRNTGIQSMKIRRFTLINCHFIWNE